MLSLLLNDYTTAPTDAELSIAGTKWVTFSFVAAGSGNDMLVSTSSKALPATATGSLFNVTGVCEVIAIVWVITTVIQAQACNLKLATVSNAATTDVCANLAISGLLAQSRMSITGTFANAMINTLAWVPVARQATSFVVQEGTISAITSALLILELLDGLYYIDHFKMELELQLHKKMGKKFPFL